MPDRPLPSPTESTTSRRPPPGPTALPSGGTRPYTPPAMTDPIKLLLREPFTRLSRRFLSLAADGTITPAEHLLVTAIADKTVSWRRLWEKLTYSELQTATGLSRQKIRDGLEALHRADILVRKPVGRSYAYALVPPGMTAAQMEALYVARGAGLSVDNVESSVYSVDRDRSTHKTDLGAGTYIDLKKELRRASGHVDRGLKEKADTSCPNCEGEGWVVRVLADGFTEEVARCPCTGS